MTSVSQSADKAYYGKLTRFCNRYLKYVLVLRAQGMSSSDKGNPMRETCWRVFFRSKANHAKIAVARQLTRVIYRMLKSSSDWEPSKITDRRELSASRKVGTQTRWPDRSVSNSEAPTIATANLRYLSAHRELDQIQPARQASATARATATAGRQTAEQATAPA